VRVKLLPIVKKYEDDIMAENQKYEQTWEKYNKDTEEHWAKVDKAANKKHT